MRLLKVLPGGLVFGCIRAKDMGGNDVVILIYENIKYPYATRIPSHGELVLCDHVHASVFHPLAIVDEGHLCLRKLKIPMDLVQSYFPLFEHIAVAANGNRSTK